MKCPTIKTTQRTEAPRAINYKFFLETSASVDGYLTTPNNRFIKAFRELHGRLASRSDASSFEFYEINSRQYVATQPDPVSTSAYFTTLNVGTVDLRANSHGESRRESPLNKNLATILASRNTNEVDIYITDGIVDVKGDLSQLTNLKGDIQASLTGALRQDKSLGVMVVRDSSEFEGKYFPPQGGSEAISGNVFRPFFIIVIGPASTLVSITKGLEGDDRFGQNLLFGSKSESPPVVLKPSGLGHYASPCSPEALVATNADLAGPKNDFELLLQVNLNNVAVSDGYKRDPANYEVKPDGYALAIEQIESEGFSHQFRVSAGKLRPAHNVTIKLRNNLPNWVADLSSPNMGTIMDKPGEIRKTFGLSSIIEGFKQGLNQSAYVFELRPITVKQ